MKSQKTRTRKLYSDYLQILHKQGKREKLLEEAKNMHLLYDDDILPLEWICKVYNESYVECTVLSESIEDNVKEFCEKLLKIQENSGMGLFTKAVLLFKEGRISEAEQILRKGLFIWLSFLVKTFVISIFSVVFFFFFGKLKYIFIIKNLY